jgi:hypothetical protein
MWVKDLYGDDLAGARISRAMDRPHAAAADVLEKLVVVQQIRHGLPGGGYRLSRPALWPRCRNNSNLGNRSGAGRSYTDGEMTRTKLRWRRLLVNPRTEIESREGDVTRLRVEGLVCSTVCAVRTREALAALPGVRSVRVDFETGIATIEGEPHDPETYERAVTAVVAGRSLRRAIEHAAARLRLGGRHRVDDAGEGPETSG